MVKHSEKFRCCEIVAAGCGSFANWWGLVRPTVHALRSRGFDPSQIKWKRLFLIGSQTSPTGNMYRLMPAGLQQCSLAATISHRKRIHLDCVWFVKQGFHRITQTFRIQKGSLQKYLFRQWYLFRRSSIWIIRTLRHVALSQVPSRRHQFLFHTTNRFSHHTSPSSTFRWYLGSCC
jgi:hypothetical protein